MENFVWLSNITQMRIDDKIMQSMDITDEFRSVKRDFFK